MSKSTTLPKEISEYFAALGPKGAASIKGTEARQRSDPRRWQPQSGASGWREGITLHDKPPALRDTILVR
jgi:hypothetical protein